jgi:transcriptional regulator with XRE-family HTH domain
LKKDARSLEMAQEIDTAAALWKNIEALMKRRYGKVSLSLFSADCGFAQSTATRIKQQKTAVGLDKLDMIAREFGISTWQLLVPSLDPENPPALAPVSKAEQEAWARWRAVAKEIVAAEPDTSKS